ncbi:MAG TPA: type II toxin-antitoxin system RelE/ParE family toxin [Polyangiaceae bacterium]|nr:type II toxin-antitoxin system RelE/ParE family toxin [Polyangiaceae bacterium]
MKLSISWHPRAAKERDKLDQVARARVLAALDRFAETGHGDVKALAGHVGEYRLRAGDWRVRFALDAARAELVVLHVLHRREAYRD